ncbi:MAG: hypothetical protein V1882_11360 [Candidatus Omnitrophota bacterium]
MKNCRESLLFVFLSVFVIANSVSGYATTVEEKKAAANYDETLPGASEQKALEEMALAEQVLEDTTSAPTVVPSVASSKTQVIEKMPLAMETPETVMPKQVVVPSVALPKTQVAVLPVVSSKTQAVKTAGAVAPPVVSKVAPQAALKEMPEDQVFGASNPSGLVEVSGYKYPVFLFAPKDYKLDRTYAMIMIAPAEDAKAEQQIEYLSGLAQRKSLFILAPYVLWPKGGDTPYTLDTWLLDVKRDMVERFPISKDRVYLVGKDSGAHYAAYMATKHPKEFAAAALLGQAWAGPFSELVQPQTDGADQIPFFVALKTGSDARAKNQAWFDKFQGNGYPIHLVEYKNDEDLGDLEFKKSAFEWMETASQNWATSVSKQQKTWKGKFKKGVKDFFAV